MGERVVGALFAVAYFDQWNKLANAKGASGLLTYDSDHPEFPLFVAGRALDDAEAAYQAMQIVYWRRDRAREKEDRKKMESR